jgi:hypothetical protein
MTCPGIQATHQSETTKAVSHRTLIVDRPVDAAAAIEMNPDALRAKDEARAAITMTTIIDRAVGTSPGASQVSATVMTTMTGRAAATSLAAL